MMPTPHQRMLAQQAMTRTMLALNLGVEGSMLTVASLSATMIRTLADQFGRDVRDVLRRFTKDIIDKLNLLEEATPK